MRDQKIRGSPPQFQARGQPMSELGEWDDDTEIPAEAHGSLEPIEAGAEGGGVGVPEPWSPSSRKNAPQAYRRSLSGTERTGAPPGGNTKKPSADSKALWRAWEYPRLDPSKGTSIWRRDHTPTTT